VHRRAWEEAAKLAMKYTLDALEDRPPARADRVRGDKEAVRECCKAFTHVKTCPMPWWPCGPVRGRVTQLSILMLPSRMILPYLA